MNAIAIVVTYNRRRLLEKCLFALNQQSTQLAAIAIIDNASTDDTEAWFNQSAYKSDLKFIYQRSNINLGGAGGFNLGLKYAQEQGYDWAWIMDDDAVPEIFAFEELSKHVKTQNDIYGSIAIQGEKTSWDTTLLYGSNYLTTDKLSDIPNIAEVNFLPFLGLLISSKLTEKIGLPDSEFFIAGDDLEYCLRAKSNGSKIFVVGGSKIHHPKADIRDIYILSIKIRHLKVPPWKNYYNVRNKIIISKRYYSKNIILKTMSGILVRMLISFLLGPQKFMHMYSTLAAIVDGTLNRKGKRHVWWKIPQQ